MNKFQLTKPDGSQTILETDVPYSLLQNQFGPSVDILPIYDNPVDHAEDAPKSKRKVKEVE